MSIPGTGQGRDAERSSFAGTLSVPAPVDTGVERARIAGLEEAERTLRPTWPYRWRERQWRLLPLACLKTWYRRLCTWPGSLVMAGVVGEVLRRPSTPIR